MMSELNGSVVVMLSVCETPVTLCMVRVVVIRPGMLGALTLARLRSIRLNGSPAAAKYCGAVTSKVTVGLTARLARIDPAPRSNGSDGVTPSSLTTPAWTDEVIMADLICPGVQLG